MVLEDKITEIEQMLDWKEAISLLTNTHASNLDDDLRLIFLLFAFLCEGSYTREEHDYVAKELKFFFDKANRQFENDAQFLFFTGFIACGGEWYFGFDSIDPCIAMLKKAVAIEPNNALYQWGYYASIDQSVEQATDIKLKFSEQLLSEESYRLDWLNTKGLLGNYLLRIFEGMYKDLKLVKSKESHNLSFLSQNYPKHTP